MVGGNHTFESFICCALISRKNFSVEKSHTIKNLILIDKNRVIKFRSKTDVQILADLGFLGLKNKNISIKIPFKKSKKKILTENRLQNSKRVLIEQVFAHLKTLRILKDVIRSYKSSFIRSCDDIRYSTL